MKWFCKPDAETMKGRGLIFLWIALCNVAAQLLHGALASIGIASWTIFLANVLYCIMENPNMKERYLQSICGGALGLVCAAGLVKVKLALTGAGLPEMPATLIPVIAVLFLTLFLHPVCPYFCNNIALAFFTVALISAKAVYANLPGHLLGMLLGNLIVNTGVILVVRFHAKRQAAKTAG